MCKTFTALRKPPRPEAVGERSLYKTEPALLIDSKHEQQLILFLPSFTHARLSPQYPWRLLSKLRGRYCLSPNPQSPLPLPLPLAIGSLLRSSHFSLLHYLLSFLNRCSISDRNGTDRNGSDQIGSHHLSPIQS